MIAATDKQGRKRRFIKEHAARLNVTKIKTRHSGKTHYRWKGGRVIDQFGYLLIKKREHPFAKANGYVYEHRLVVEEFLGRYLTQAEIVHHKNGIRHDNRIENLELTDRAQHISYHHRGKIVSNKTRMIISEIRKREGPRKRDSQGRFLS